MAKRRKHTAKPKTSQSGVDQAVAPSAPELIETTTPESSADEQLNDTRTITPDDPTTTTEPQSAPAVEEESPSLKAEPDGTAPEPEAPEEPAPEEAVEGKNDQDTRDETSDATSSGDEEMEDTFVPPEDAESAETPDDTTSSAAPPIKRSGRKWAFAVAAFLALLCIGIAATLLAYQGKALPGTQVAGVNVSGKTPAQIENIARQQAKKISLTFATKDKSDTTAPTPSGISFDAKQSAKSAVAAKRSSWIDTISFWRTESVPLSYRINRTALDAYLTKNVMVGWKLPEDASLVFNPETKTYDVTKPVPGEGIHMYQVTQALDAAALKPGAVTIPVKRTPTNASIGLAAAQQAQTTANGYLKSDIQMFHQGKRVFFLEPQEIDTLIDIIPNKAKKSIDVSVNADRVQKFVDTDITSTIAQAARDRVTITNPSTGEVLVLQEGNPGQKLINNTGLAKQITAALKEHKTIKPDIDVEEGSFGQKNFTGVNRWAEVNLTQQMAYMHLDDQVIMSFRISSGRAATPSDPGEWKISRKVPLQTMAGVINGEAYRVPNVPWVSYFNPDAEAFHGTYWHNNFGTPMSHGCINMTIPDAHMMYNFAYIGMRVSVHY